MIMNIWRSRILQQAALGRRTIHIAAARNYEDAVMRLADMEHEKKVPTEKYKKPELRRAETLRFLSRLGVNSSDIDKLSVIHMTGTKGKGSTSIFCESILRHHGIKTGFMNSPHLLETRERYRINGVPLTREAFSKYFWDCIDRLESTKFDDNDMPYRSSFFLSMALHVFVQEKVDMAIIEVGIGGRYDATNIFRSPVVCGVSSLDVDHVDILGNTIEDVAWHKAGIFKPLVPAVTVPQPANAMEILLNCAKERQSPLYVTKDFESYNWGGLPIVLGIPGEVQKLNAALALDVCNIWLNDHGKDIDERKSHYSGVMDQYHTVNPTSSFKITEPMQKGLKDCEWAGRFHTIRQEGLTYYLDVAHTPISIQECSKWFQNEAEKEKKALKGKVVKVLLFYASSDRDHDQLLNYLKAGNFDCAIFCPNIMDSSSKEFDDLTQKLMIEMCVAWTKIWGQLKPDRPSETRKPAFAFNTVKDALVWLEQGRDSNLPPGGQHSNGPPGGTADSLPEAFQAADHIQVLCTGSVSIVRNVMRLSTPELE